MINCSRLTEEGAGSRWRVSGGGSRMVTECVGDSESSTVRKQVENKWRMMTALQFTGTSYVGPK